MPEHEYEYETRPTATILASNSDDRLSQRAWSEMVSAIRQVVVIYTIGGKTLFEGFTDGAEQWQTACWVVVLPDDPFAPARMRDRLRDIAAAFDQDAVIWLQTDRIVYLSAAA